jgi:hypothetical protein
MLKRRDRVSRSLFLYRNGSILRFGEDEIFFVYRYGSPFLGPKSDK